MPRATVKRRVRGSGALFRSGNVWIARQRIGGKLVERRASTATAALAKLAAVMPPTDETTVSEWCTRWLAEQRVRPATHASRKVSVHKHIVPTLGTVRLGELSAYQVESAANMWGDSLHVNTVRQVVACLRTAVGAAVRAGLRTDNPVNIARKPKGTRRKIVPLPPAELARIVTAASQRPATRIVAMLASTGMRVGEALALDVGDYNPATGTLSITKSLDQRRRLGPPKTANGIRTIRIPRPGRPAVLAAIGKRTRGPLFATRTGGRGMYLSARGAWLRMLKRLGLPARGLHELRHSVISLAIAEGVPIANIARDVGDAVQTIVATYIHPVEGTSVADAMDRLLIEPPT